MANTPETTIDDEVRMTETARPKAARRTAKPGVRDTMKARLVEQRDTLKSQAQEKAREYAEQGKVKATDTLDGVSRFFDDTARALDDQLGADIGDYVHRAAAAIEGFTDTLKQKDVEELLVDARDLVRRNPAIAIGAAAAVGFVLVRLLKSAAPLDGGDDSQPPRTGKAPSAKSIKADS